jgi:hypothetical protein
MPTLDLVLPLRAIVLQALFLTVAVAIEAVVFERQFGISRSGSVIYSFAVNLVSTVIGWSIMLTIEPFLPADWRMAAMSFVFFNQVFGNLDVSVIVPVLAFCTFLGTLFIELQAMNLFLMIWSPDKPQLQHDTSDRKYDRTQRYRNSASSRYRSNALLKANGYSYGAILLLLLVLQRTRFI